MSAGSTSLIHPTYRYLDRWVRLAGLTVWQWTQLVGAGIGAWLLARVLPFSGTYDLSIGITIAGVPIAASLAAGADSAHPLKQLRAVITWRRQAGIYLPGATAASVAGYRLLAEQSATAAAGPSIATVEELWD
jgi:hypothetical protein